jgi:dolichol-phosphate mannosyltransferase
MTLATTGSAPRPAGDAELHSSGYQSDAQPLDLSVLIPALNEGKNLTILLPQLNALLKRLKVQYEIFVLTQKADQLTQMAAREHGARVVEQTRPGYGGALVSGFAEARGEYLLTMDADLSHPPEFVDNLWEQRHEADVTIASRYLPGGHADMGMYRYALSRILNAAFSRGLDVPIHDLSSGFRLYRTAVIRGQQITSRDFDVLQQIVVQAFAEGWRVREVPFSYQPRKHGSSNARVLRVGVACMRTFGQLWRLRNSILAADYDDRAHDSRIPLQRYWQRSRFRHVTELIAGEGPVLDVGCGSSRIIGSLPHRSVGVDILQRKLRYARRFSRPLVRASAFALPFPDASFSCVLCSQVIEHVPKDSPVLDELCRVLRPGGRLVLGTPDYANWQWVYIEKLYGLVPGGYADEHISHYTNAELVRIMRDRGLSFEQERYILRGELIQAFRKAGSASQPGSPGAFPTR